MPIILKAVPLGTSWRHRQYWIQTVQSLDGRLLVHAEYGGVLRRLQVQPDDVGSFAFKVRIVTGHIPFQAVRLQSRFVPDTLYSVFADVEVLGQLAARPVRRPVAGFLPGGAQYFRLQGRRDHGRLLPGMPHLQKPGHAPFLKTRPPACDRRRCGGQFFFDRAIRQAFCQQQNQARAEDIPRRKRARPAHLLQLPSFLQGQHKRLRSEGHSPD